MKRLLFIAILFLSVTVQAQTKIRKSLIRDMPIDTTAADMDTAQLRTFIVNALTIRGILPISLANSDSANFRLDASQVENIAESPFTEFSAYIKPTTSSKRLVLGASPVYNDSAQFYVYQNEANTYAAKLLNTNTSGGGLYVQGGNSAGTSSIFAGDNGGDSLFVVEGDGTIRLPKYGAGTLSTDINGKIILGGGGSSSNFSDLNDVTISTPATNDIPRYNGSIWVNGTGGLYVDGGIYKTANQAYSIRFDDSQVLSWYGAAAELAFGEKSASVYAFTDGNLATGTTMLDFDIASNTVGILGNDFASVSTGTSDNDKMVTAGWVADTINAAIIAGGSYTDEAAQDAVGGILDNGTTGDIVFTYDDPTPLISGVVKANGIDDTMIDFGTGANQVSAADFAFTDSYYTATNVNTALIEAGDSLAAISGRVGTGGAGFTQEQIEDFAGAMFSGNTETLITATYQDADGTIDLVVDNDLANYSNTNSGFLTSEVDGSITNEIEVVDEIFNATNFNGDVTSGVSQDDFYDRFHLFDADDDGDFTDETWFPSASGAPTDASYITQVPEAGLSAEQALSSLTSGFVTVTNGTGVLSSQAAINLSTDITGTLSETNIDADIARDSELPTQASLSVDDLITLSGVSEGSTNLGTFTGSTILDNRTNKQALQDLETAVEGLGGGHDPVTLAGTLNYLALSGQEITLNQIDLTTDVSGALPIANGGTGQTTASGAINALLPSQTGNSGKFLTTNGTIASWGAVPGGGDMLASTYDPASISEQLVGLTATQTLTNKTLTQPILTMEQSTSPASIVSGRLQYDTDDGVIKVGTGSAQLVFIPQSMLDYFTGADITGSESAFTGWDKNASDDFSGSFNDLSDVPTTVSGYGITDAMTSWGIAKNSLHVADVLSSYDVNFIEGDLTQYSMTGGSTPSITIDVNLDLLGIDETATATDSIPWIDATTGQKKMSIGALGSLIGGGTATSINGLTDGKTNTWGLFLGTEAGASDAGGNQNLAIGDSALYSNDDFYNTAVGFFSLKESTGTENTALGTKTLLLATTGNANTAIGNISMWNVTTGSNNTAIGSSSGFRNTTGSNNIFIGYEAGAYHSDGSTMLTTPENSIYIGSQSKGNDNDDSNSIVIGYGSISNGANTTVIGNSSTTDTYLEGSIHLDNPITPDTTQVISYSATMEMDWLEGKDATISSISGDVTSFTITNVPEGASGTIEFDHNGSARSFTNLYVENQSSTNYTLDYKDGETSINGLLRTDDGVDLIVYKEINGTVYFAVGHF